MAYGPTIRLTHAGNSGSPIFLSDVRLRTDGPHYAHDHGRGGGVYVPVGGFRDLPFTGDVARSYEFGAIRGFIDSGDLTVSWIHGTEFADAFSQTVQFAASLADSSTDTFFWIVPADAKVLSVKVYANEVPINAGGYTLAVEGGGNNLLSAATFDMESIAQAGVVQSVGLTAITANLSLSEDDVVKVTLAASGVFSAGSGVVVALEWAHR